MCFGSDCFAQLPIVAQYGRFRGGAVYASDIEIYGSILGGNEAPGKSGGAVYLREGGKSLIVNTVIYNNTASTGSAYYAESGSTSQLINNTIVRNAHAENVSGDVTSGSTVYSASTAGNNLTNTVIWGMTMPNVSMQIIGKLLLQQPMSMKMQEISRSFWIGLMKRLWGLGSDFPAIMPEREIISLLPISLCLRSRRWLTGVRMAVHAD